MKPVLAVALCVWLAALLCGKASAQVASPPLRGGAILLTAANPATQQWETPAISAGSWAGENRYTSPAGTHYATIEFSGPFVRGRYQGETGFIALDVMRLRETKPYDLTGAIVYPEEVKYYQGALGLDIKDVLSVTVSREEERRANNDNTDTYSKITRYGASFRHNELIYIGASQGEDRVFDPRLAPGEVGRAVKAQGVGLLWRDKTRAVRLEIGQQTKDPVPQPEPVTMFNSNAQELVRYYSAETILWGFLAGIGGFDLTSDYTGISDGYKEKRRGYFLGWRPQEGFGIEYYLQRVKGNWPMRTKLEGERHSVSVHWYF